MDAICQQYFPQQLKNLQTIPGIKGHSATAIIAEVGTNTSSFEDAAHLVSWCGLMPSNEESSFLSYPLPIKVAGLPYAPVMPYPLLLISRTYGILDL